MENSEHKEQKEFTRVSGFVSIRSIRFIVYIRDSQKARTCAGMIFAIFRHCGNISFLLLTSTDC